MPTFISPLILTVVKRKRKRKPLQLKRKINIFIKKLNYFH